MRIADLPDVGGFAAFLSERAGMAGVQVFGVHHPPLSDPKGEGVAKVHGSDPQPLHGRKDQALPVIVDPFESGDQSIEAFTETMERSSVGLVAHRGEGGVPHEMALEQLEAHGLRVVLHGHTRDYDTADSSRKSSLFICENRELPLSQFSAQPSSDFMVIAFMIVYNESDVFEASLDALNSHGVEAYVIDNWSTDGTYEMARERVGRGVTGVERYPQDEAPEYFDLKSLLVRVEALVGELDGDWYIKHDADEVREGPWPGIPLRDAIWMADVAGYNCLDFTVLNFRPVDDSYVGGADLVDQFEWFEFGRNPGHFKQWKAWKNFGQEIDYARFGSHSISFPGLKVFPYKFLLRHYPIRSQSHGERKVFAERQSRFLPDAKKRGWHKQYDHVEPGHSFISDPIDLVRFGPDFADMYLVERLSGVGLERIQL